MRLKHRSRPRTKRDPGREIAKGYRADYEQIVILTGKDPPAAYNSDSTGEPCSAAGGLIQPDCPAVSACAVERRLGIVGPDRVCILTP